MIYQPLTTCKTGYYDLGDLFFSNFQHCKCMETIFHGLSQSFIKTSNLEFLLPSNQKSNVSYHLTVRASNSLLFPSPFYPNSYSLSVFRLSIIRSSTSIYCNPAVSQVPSWLLRIQKKIAYNMAYACFLNYAPYFHISDCTLFGVLQFINLPSLNKTFPPCSWAGYKG